MIPLNIDAGGFKVSVDWKAVLEYATCCISKSIAERKEKLFAKDVTNLGLAEALVSVMQLLLEDRITEGIGIGGWSKSAPNYVELIYGKEPAAAIFESMTDTSLVVEALMAYNDFVKSSPKIDQIPVYDESLKAHLDRRWNPDKGYAGTIKIDREGGLSGEHLRHTAMITRVFGQVPALKRNLGKTLEFLANKVENMNRKEWDDEKIATPVAVYVAMKYARSGHYLTDDLIKKVTQSAIDQMISRYDPALKGWHSGPSIQTSLPYYTLYLICETSDLWNTETSLKLLMKESFEELMKSIVTCTEGSGICIYGNKFPDVGLTSMMISALLQKPHRSKSEQEALEKMLSFVIVTINSKGGEVFKNSFSWPLTYFVRDLCRYFIKHPAS